MQKSKCKNQNDNVKLKIFATIFSFFLILSSFQFSSAQIPGEGLTISPPIFELTLKEGETSTQTIKITNPTQNLMEVYPLIMNFRAKGETGEPAFYPATEEEAKFSLAHWIKFSQSKIALTPEQIVEFNYKITVPDGAEPGGHYGVVFFATEPPKPEQDVSQVAIASMIGSLVLVKIPGDINESANLKEFSSSKFYFKPPVNFIVRIANLGNVHFKPQGEILIKDWKSDTAGRVEVNESKGNVLPDSTRKFEESWKPQKWYTIGRFKANLNLTYGDNNKTLTGSLVFWIIPWWFIVLLVVILAVIIYFIVRWWKKRPKKRYRERKIILR